MEGWPEGWHCHDGEVSSRFVRADDRYVLYGDREGCRRAAWAIEGGPTIDREKLAKALHDAYAASTSGTPIEWKHRSEDSRKGYLAEADEAIRLIGFEAGVDRIEALTKIEGLERANAALQNRLTSAERERENFRIAHSAAIIDGNASVRRLTEKANAAVARAEEAQAKIEELERRNAALTSAVDTVLARAEKAEEERDVLRDYDSPFEEDAEDLRAEVQRLQRVVARTAQAAARLADALSEIGGGDDA